MTLMMICMSMMYFGLKMFFSHKKHLILMLLTLEFMSLVILVMLVNMMSMFNYDFSLIIYLIIVMVCEAVMGLVLLTSVVRVHGSDYIKGMSLLMC
uniref:NADH-ubiquinone oxidoreductase chain 4L n=1 Tax=Livia junci TaxID=1449964 RepID=A0A344A2J2_9HEMI|nr:NADH dehydrogenase subunit 4L [Livia junci]AWU48983.1 NADH dehydrogenase subunit 4L [Livia junci]